MQDRTAYIGKWQLSNPSVLEQFIVAEIPVAKYDKSLSEGIDEELAERVRINFERLSEIGVSFLGAYFSTIYGDIISQANRKSNPLGSLNNFNHRSAIGTIEIGLLK